MTHKVYIVAVSAFIFIYLYTYSLQDTSYKFYPFKLYVKNHTAGLEPTSFRFQAN